MPAEANTPHQVTAHPTMTITVDLARGIVRDRADSVIRIGQLPPGEDVNIVVDRSDGITEREVLDALRMAENHIRAQGLPPASTIEKSQAAGVGVLE